MYCLHAHGYTAHTFTSHKSIFILFSLSCLCRIVIYKERKTNFSALLFSHSYEKHLHVVFPTIVSHAFPARYYVCVLCDIKCLSLQGQILTYVYSQQQITARYRHLHNYPYIIPFNGLFFSFWRI